MNRKRLILIIVVAGILAAVGIGLYMYNKPHVNIQDTEPAYSLDAQSLVMDFKIADKKANEKYVNRVIEVNGEIKKIQQTRRDLWVVSLYSEFEGVTCMLDSAFVTKNQEMVKGLTKGDRILVKGLCDGSLMDVKMSRCIILEN